MTYVRYVILSLSALMAVPFICLAEYPGEAQAKGFFFTGEARLIGNGAAWTWVECDAKGTPLRMGITFTETVLSGLPAESASTGQDDWEHPLPLPAQADAAPFTHITMNWNPHGHIPPGVYDVPHFDSHFYIINPAEWEQITCKVTRTRQNASGNPMPDTCRRAISCRPGLSSPKWACIGSTLRRLNSTNSPSPGPSYTAPMMDR